MSSSTSDVMLSIEIFPATLVVNLEGEVSNIVPLNHHVILGVILGVGLPSNIHCSITVPPICLTIAAVSRVTSGGSEKVKHSRDNDICAPVTH